MKKVILTEKAPQPIGPYSQATRVGDFLFCSGCISLDPKSGAIVAEGDVVGQAKQVMENLKAVVEAGGGTICLLYTSPSPRD